MQGFTFYEGPSVIDGQPVIAVATGLTKPSPNIKTGPMVQVYFLRGDRHPMEAVNTGDDASICGSCPHRGSVVTDPTTGKRSNSGRSCYVTIMHGPRMVWEAHKRGNYPLLTPAQARTALRGRKVRLGAYGDPGAVPVAILRESLGLVREMTGYTHLWRRFPELSEFCMASCDSEADRDAAKSIGFRTFRVRAKGDALMPGEGHCPASVEMGHATRCDSCLICGGARSKAKADITILAHGVGAKHFTPEHA